MTWINEKYKFAFIHIPKTAGTSINELFSTLEGNKKIHGTHCPLYKLEMRRDFDSSKYYVFSFVRNPWDRILSTFQYYKDQKRVDRNMEFNEWVVKEFSVIPKEVFDQCRWISNTIDYVGKTETITEDLEHICSDLKITNLIDISSLQRLNTTTHKPYQEVYTDITREYIAKYFTRDIERFGYKF